MKLFLTLKFIFIILPTTLCLLYNVKDESLLENNILDNAEKVDSCHKNEDSSQHTIAKRSIRSEPSGRTMENPDMKYLKQKMNEDTSRALRDNIVFLMYGIKDQFNVSENWKFMQKANLILKTTCPNLDPIVHNSMVRMFRMLFGHSKDGPQPNRGYLHYSSRTDRILSNLDRCATESKKIEYTYDPCNNTILYVTVIGDNTTTHSGEDLILPPSEEFMKDKHDILIESMWKMISFLHFYCAEYFSETPFDYSALMQMLTGYFNNDMLYRWYHPEVENNGIYELFNAKSQIDFYTKQLDTCVAVAKKIANYKKWLIRPKWEHII